MTCRQVHQSTSAKSGPPTDRRPAPAPPPPPPWRHWLLVAGVVLTAALFIFSGVHKANAPKSCRSPRSRPM